MYTVLIADDQPLIRSGLCALVDACEDFTVVAEASDGAEALTETTTHQPDLVLLDLEMPRVNGLDCARRLVKLPHPPHVLIISAFHTDDRILDALQIGASGFLLKDLRPQELRSALYAAVSGMPVFAPEVAGQLLERAAHHGTDRICRAQDKLATLTDSERQVLTLLGEGRSNRGISRELHLSNASVRTYVSRALTKLGLENRTQAALLAHDAGLTLTRPADHEAERRASCSAPARPVGVDAGEGNNR